MENQWGLGQLQKLVRVVGGSKELSNVELSKKLQEDFSINKFDADYWTVLRKTYENIKM